MDDATINTTTVDYSTNHPSAGLPRRPFSRRQNRPLSHGWIQPESVARDAGGCSPPDIGRFGNPAALPDGPSAIRVAEGIAINAPFNVDLEPGNHLGSTMGFDIEVARRFLNLLDSEADTFTFQTFSDSPAAKRRKQGSQDPLAAIYHGSLDQHWRTLCAKQQAGAGVFVTVNATDGHGRRLENMVRVRALFQEDDTLGRAPPLPLEPQIIVESSPGKYHRYLLADGLDWPDYDRTMRVIVERHGSDPNAKDRTRVLRLPGFFHLKTGTPHMVRMIHESGAQPYTQAQIRAAFPAGDAGGPRDDIQSRWVTQETRKELESALCSMPADDYGLWVRMGLALKELGDLGRELWMAWSVTSDKFKQAEAAEKWDRDFNDPRSSYEAVFAEAQRRGWVNPRSSKETRGDRTMESARQDRGADDSSMRNATDTPERGGVECDFASEVPEESSHLMNKDALALIQAAERIDDEEERHHELLQVIAPKVYLSDVLSEVERRKLLGKIAKLAGTNYGTLKADLGAYDRVQASKDFDHLKAAREVAKAFGEGNLLAQPGFLWTWQKGGVWARTDDRVVKQQIHDVAGSNELTKSIVDSILDLVKTETFLPDHHFDVDTSTINCRNGELRWTDKDWELIPHCREHYRTTQIPVRYDPTRRAPRFEQFLGEIFKGDHDASDKIRVVLQMMGYSLLATCRYERFIILVGCGANGKSVLLAVVQALCGLENVSAVQPCQFDNRFQRAHLYGKLANIVTEIAEGAEMADAALKAIVSGELTTAEHKHKPPFDFAPFATCWFGTNHMPHTRDFSDAMFRRAFVVPFNRKFEGADCDEGLKDKLIDELPGILNLSLRAIGDVFQHGFVEPASCVKAKQDWRLQCDQLGRFVEECCARAPGNFVTSQVLYNRYLQWAKVEGITTMLGKNAVTTRLKILGFESGHNPARTARVIWGLRVTW